MKKFLLSTVAIAMLSTAASAADLDVAPEPILDNWAGWYVGINGGYGFSNNPNVSWSISEYGGDFRPAHGNRSIWDTDMSGFFGGGQVGYNWQDDIYVYGLEGDFQFSGIDGRDGEGDSEDGGFYGLERYDRASQKLKWFSTVRGRYGVSPSETLLFYATAGLAFGQVKHKGNGYYNYFDTGFNETRSYNGSSSKTKVGWTVGFGGELKVTENVSFKVEYLYLDLGKTTVKSQQDYECQGSCRQTLEFSPLDVKFRHKFKNQFHTVKAGFNWGF
jgi:outer membrane immunogenic protein